MKELTRRQAEVYKYIWSRIEIHHIPPTRREIQAYMGFKSVYAVTVHLKALIRKEWIWMVPNQSRNIRLREE